MIQKKVTVVIEMRENRMQYEFSVRTSYAT